MNDLHSFYSWKTALKFRRYKVLLAVGLGLAVITLSCLPAFFDKIEARNGIVLNDIVLNWLPIINLSVPIFIVVWSMASLMAIRGLRNPYTTVLFIWSFLILTLSRIVTISLVPLNAPNGLIILKDPLSNTFYRGPFITKDLFYSGHTSTMFLMFLCLQRRVDKIVALCATIAIGTMVMIQHVHYAIDVIAAPPMTYLVYISARLIIRKSLRIKA